MFPISVLACKFANHKLAFNGPYMHFKKLRDLLKLLLHWHGGIMYCLHTLHVLFLDPIVVHILARL
jgi:hypothetical protein